MYVNNFIGRKYLSIITAVLILIMSISAPTAAFASESEGLDASTQSAADISTQSAAEVSAQSALGASSESAIDVTSSEPFHYQHDPMENPNAA